MNAANAMRTVRKLLALVLFGAIASGCTPAPQQGPPPAARAALDRAQALRNERKADEAVAACFEAIEADPDFLAAHQWLAEFSGSWPVRTDAKLKSLDQAIGAKYEDWERRFPDSLGVLYGLGARLSDQESPQARAYLLKFAARDASNPEVFTMLAGDALMSGDQPAAVEYFRKAMLLEPDNPQRALSYARFVEPSKREAALMDIIKRFPNTDSAARVLSILSWEATDDAHRIEYLEQLRTQLSSDASAMNAYSNAYNMGRLFELYLHTDPNKALEFAQQMQASKDSKEWPGRVELAQTYIEVSRKLAAGQSREALTLLDKLKPQKNSSNTGLIERTKAQVLVQAGQAQAGYRGLLLQQAKVPDDETLTTLQTIGQQLHKTPAQVKADITTAIYAEAKPAPLFDLQQYASDEMVSLEKLRGKAVLLTFWFPGCGPCAAEFPHLEAVMGKLRQTNADIAYVGVNIERDQDPYVLPLVQKKGYSFTPVKGTDAVKDAQTGYNVRAAPTNFVIDGSGKIVYRDFVIRDARDELMLQRMIESVL